MEKPREKFSLSWSKSIVRAAKEGVIDQQELDWDGYDKIKEITFKQLQGAIEEEEAEERIKERTFERESKEGEEKMVRVAQKRVERKEKVKAREAAKRGTENQIKKQKSSVARKLTLKQKLTKIRKRKSINDQMIRQGASLTFNSLAWEKLDVEIKHLLNKSEMPKTKELNPYADAVYKGYALELTLDHRFLALTIVSFPCPLGKLGAIFIGFSPLFFTEIGHNHIQAAVKTTQLKCLNANSIVWLAQHALYASQMIIMHAKKTRDKRAALHSSGVRKTTIQYTERNFLHFQKRPPPVPFTFK
ncbi:hypothetical protein SADUNF_Sadunf11G0077200 [Salix dunnii]|uniref:Uncharacterized protein n=1 Tax=Salix dunnii TaxID=1413687 RepID=A0A835MQI1_9ROSI|nr:hypothetical protein SADUNF_Sadunf11G0077200 [Salix dunnii]